jgi:hypothetical protein
MPFWIADDVDGIETICRAAGVTAPGFVVPARRLFAGAAETLPQLGRPTHTELRGPRDVGAFVSASDVPALLDFLNDHGSQMIQAASHHGEGSACGLVLRKIRECATYAQRHGLGYLEASGIPAPESVQSF